MDPGYETVVDPTTIVWTMAAMGLHVAMVALQLALVVYLGITGLQVWFAPKDPPRWLRRLGASGPGDAKPSLFVSTRFSLALGLLLPALVGSPFWVSVGACGASLLVLALHERGLEAEMLRPGRFSRRLAIVGVGVVALFAIWEQEDGLALGVELTANAQAWRVHELDWQLESDLEAPKVGDLAPDFELQDPDGRVAVRLSEFRGKRPVALAFGSYT